MSGAREFFGLYLDPFRPDNDLRFLYLSVPHERAVKDLAEAIQARIGLMVVTGLPGSGRTTLCRALPAVLGGQVDVCHLPAPPASGTELLAAILKEFGLPPAADEHEGLAALEGFLTGALRTGRTALIIIDNAEALSPEVVETLKAMTVLEVGVSKLAQVILVGDRELYKRVRRALGEPVEVPLGALHADEVGVYVDRRLQVAGAPEDGMIFDDGAMKALASLSHGLPGEINPLCERAMDLAAASGEHLIGATVVRRAAAGQGTAKSGFAFSWPRLLFWPVAVILVAAGIWWVQSGGEKRPAKPSVQAERSQPPVKVARSTPVPPPAAPVKTPIVAQPAPPVKVLPSTPAPPPAAVVRAPITPAVPVPALPTLPVALKPQVASPTATAKKAISVPPPVPFTPAMNAGKSPAPAAPVMGTAQAPASPAAVQRVAGKDPATGTITKELRGTTVTQAPAPTASVSGDLVRTTEAGQMGIAALRTLLRLEGFKDLDREAAKWKIYQFETEGIPLYLRGLGGAQRVMPVVLLNAPVDRALTLKVAWMATLRKGGASRLVIVAPTEEGLFRILDPQSGEKTATRADVRKLVTGPAVIIMGPAKEGPRLEAGAKGAPVEKLRALLRKGGFLKAPGKGTYDSETEKAVRSLEGAFGLIPTGVAGPEVWAIGEHLDPPPATPIGS